MESYFHFSDWIRWCADHYDTESFAGSVTSYSVGGTKLFDYFWLFHRQSKLVHLYANGLSDSDVNMGKEYLLLPGFCF